jgi:hypothetical protein
MNYQKKLTSSTHGMLAARFLVVSVTSFGMIGPVLAQDAAAPPPVPSEQPAPPTPQLALPGAQQPVPPTPFDRAPEATSAHGTVSQYMMNPDGLIDGILLSDDTIVRFPAHLSQQLVQIVKPQDSVSIDGFFEFQGVIHAVKITNSGSQQSVIDVPPPSPNPPLGSGQEERQPMSAVGAIKVLVHGPRGEINGAVLENGTIVHFPPSAATQYANLFRVGSPLAAIGYGTISNYGRSLEASGIGPSADHMETVNAMDDRPGRPHRPIPVPAG